MLQSKRPIHNIDQYDQILAKYQYNFKSTNLKSNIAVFQAKNLETGQNATLKIIKQNNSNLFQYLLKLKQVKSDHVIKIIDLGTNLTNIVLVTQQVSFGTLSDNIEKCKRLEDSDAIFIIKFLLYGHIDLLRNNINWSGNENDIEFTENGLKLSWNGSILNKQNPFPKLIERISFRPQSQINGLLPFPKNKQILDLIKLSRQNASEMSLNPFFKKKQKIIKKRGKYWLALKETKSKPEYFQQTIYFAVSVYGFVRIKVYHTGKLQNQVLQLYNSKQNYVKILEIYEEDNNCYIVSEYSNDGNVQSYVNKLRLANIFLKQDQIQFFLYSLIQPIKYVQDSQILSLNTLHIKNIFIQNGIPKIGEPIPLSPNMKYNLTDRFNVPDFYHSEFKSNPQSKDPSYDTYSLGILLYKLMYTQYPIFPEGKVHIPTTPAYNQRIKATLQIFLNEGGKLANIQKKIKISQIVKRQIKQNKLKLQTQKSRKNNRINLNNMKSQSIEIQQIQSQYQIKQIQNKSHQWWQKCCDFQSSGDNKSVIEIFYFDLNDSPFRKFRIYTKIIAVLLFYLLLFYLRFFNNIVDIFATSTLIHPLTLNIYSINYTVLVSNDYNFFVKFNSTNMTLSTLTSTLNCAIDSNSQYSSLVNQYYAPWFIYLSLGLIIIIFLMILKAGQLKRFDLPKMIVNLKRNKSNYNISTYIIFNLIFALAIYSHFFLFNWIFYQQLSPCFGGNSSYWYSSTYNMFLNRPVFWQYIFPPIVSSFVLLILHFWMLYYHDTIIYTRLFNPIVCFLPFLITLIIMMRIGAYNPISPSSINDPNKIIRSYFIDSKDYVGILGFIPELLIIGQFFISGLIDWIFYMMLQRKVRMLVRDESFSYDVR